MVLAIGSVDDITLKRSSTQSGAIVIRAEGTAFAGWSGPKLEPMPDTTGDVSVMSFKLTGLSPKAATGDEPTLRLSAELVVDDLPQAVKKIRVVSATNELSAVVEDTP